MIKTPLMSVMVDAVLKAAKSLRRDFGEIENLQVSRKGPGDFVSAADHKSEQILRDLLTKARPDYSFVMEEGGIVEGRDSANRWHIDPLDGTLNFLHGIPQFSISLGLEREGVAYAGVVYDPSKDELFIAERGKGAYLNNRRMRVAARTDLMDCVIGTGIPSIGRKRHPDYLRQLSAVMLRSAGVRRMGSAALDLAYVACGRFDGFWELGLSSWDIAAGTVLVREAGGFVTDAERKEQVIGASSIVTGNESVHRELLAVLAEAAASA
jgi:myo-inositol-1(or 4)-monophosphatase